MDRVALQIILSKEQTKEIARSIYGDIADYIQAHQQEYEDFLNIEYPCLQKKYQTKK
ncbi:hypothetical protein [Ruminococcus difficilis]|uniref:Uncharacterized protein n=1 Tax=Ruminococcus difficilis TaxID=2763069 RepID=A0A934TYR9_9FIRM|nr:hypothetical protein [Ruminococcus difficilis]MBK6088276.1 hypothetical protein [Ruminococcus difficilis]